MSSSQSQVKWLGGEYELLGLTLSICLVSLYWEALEAHGVLSNQALAEQCDGRKMRVAGRAMVRQRPPSVKSFVFIT